MPNVPPPRYRGPTQVNVARELDQLQTSRNRDAVRRLTIASFLLVILTSVLGLVPWVLMGGDSVGITVYGILETILVILSVIMMVKGAVFRGVFWLLFCLIILPLWFLFACPILGMKAWRFYNEQAELHGWKKLQL
jgi:hypothetical protein